MDGLRAHRADVLLRSGRPRAGAQPWSATWCDEGAGVRSWRMLEVQAHLALGAQAEAGALAGTTAGDQYDHGMWLSMELPPPDPTISGSLCSPRPACIQDPRVAPNCAFWAVVV